MEELKAEMLAKLREYGEGLYDVDDPCYTFDMEAAIYWYASDWHDGQWSDLYAILSTSEYVPGILTSGADDVSETCAELYEVLEREF